MDVADNGRCIDYVGRAWQDREHKGEHDLLQVLLLHVGSSPSMYMMTGNLVSTRND